MTSSRFDMPSPSTANQRKKSCAAAVIFSLLALSTLLAAGLPGVPFHPDESTLLMMSADFEELWRAPLSLAWSPEKAGHPQVPSRGSLAASCLLGSNALTWLHARRAMAEAPVLLGVTAFLASLGFCQRRPWL